MKERNNLSLVERMTIVIMIVFVGAMIVSLLPERENNGVGAAETATEVQTIEVQATEDGPKAKEGFFAEDGYVRQYEDGDVFWEWQIEDLSEDAEIATMNGLMQYVAVQDDNKVWLIKGRDNAQLIAEYGDIFTYPYYDGHADGCVRVEDGALYFERLYPYSADGQTTQVELTDGVEEIIGYRGFVRDGEYWYLDGDVQDWEDAAAPAIKLGDNPIIRRDLERLRDYDMTITDFEKKYDVGQ